MKILVTGCAGFIGYHLCHKLLTNKRYHVYGIDNLNTYYDVNLKKNRLKILLKFKNRFYFNKVDITNNKKISKIFLNNKYDYVIHLAAQAGVRHSINYPDVYLKNNINGFFNILECCKRYKIKHLIFASTSSVYGSNKNFPLKETNNTDQPLSFYASTKICNEVMAHSYSYIYKLPCTGLRFFTVYGPFGRPDMVLYKFTKAIHEGKNIDLFNHGNHIRDFTYIDDVVGGIKKLIKKPSKNKIPYEIYNVGSDNPIHLKEFLKIIENNLLRKAKIILQPQQLGDVHKTHAYMNKLNKIIGYRAKVNIKQGIKNFVLWYKEYYKIKES